MFAELHCLSNFSFGRAASQAEELVAQAKALGYHALAMTDEASLAGVVRAHQAAQQHGLKLLIGARFALEDGPSFVLLAADLAAYQQISALITRGRRRAEKGHCQLRRSDCSNIDHCLALWLAEPDSADSDGHWLRERTQQTWLAVNLLRSSGDASRLRQLQALARRCGLLCVAANGVRMHHPARRPLLDVLDAVRLRKPVANCGRQLQANAEAHLRPLSELAALYPAEMLQESVAIADRCQFALDQLRYRYPRELVPEGRSPMQWLRELTAAGIAQRWPQGISSALAQQIDRELDVIEALGYEAFFLTVHDLVRFARSRGILCQGRGSAANSAVCFALGITAVDPAQQHLLFERFLSRERAEPPDIDVDFEHERREEVIQYIYAKYGRDRAALAATVICYRQRSALRDVGRALGFADDDIQRLGRTLAWSDRPQQFEHKLRSYGFDPAAPRLGQWLQLSRELIGFPRHLSQHVGGFVMSDAPLSELVPIENAAMPERSIIQWDKDDLHALGLLKVDVLALGMLTALRKTLDRFNAWNGSDLQLASIPADDAATYAMIQRAETIGVFQIESRAQQTMLPRLKPRNFYDLVIEVALVRPGPITGGMVHPYLRRRNGEEAIDYPPALAPVLERTLGVPIFQEQVMELAIIAAGFSPGEADQMRRSMAAWKRGGGLEKFHDRLTSGMLANGYSSAFAEQTYQRILGFGAYGFPESHSASFALLAYASSWLKCHAPAAFISALLDSQPMGFYPPSMLVQEARRAGVELRPVDINVSQYDCSLEPSSSGGPAPALRLGLSQIGGLRADSARRLVERRGKQPFRDIDDLAWRTGLQAAELDRLARAGALESLAGHRHRARWDVAAQQRRLDLPVTDANPDPPPPADDRLRPPSLAEDVLMDYRHLGLSLRAHPVALIREALDRARVLPNRRLTELGHGSRARIAGRVVFRQRPGTAKGVMFMTLEDETGTANLIVSARFLERHRELLLHAQLLIAQGLIQRSGAVIHLSLSRAEDISSWLVGLVSPSRDFR